MNKLQPLLTLLITSLLLFSCGENNNAQVTNNNSTPEVAIKNSYTVKTKACDGMPNEESLRNIFNIPEAAVWKDLSAQNIAAASCMIGFGNEQKKESFALAIILMAKEAIPLFEREMEAKGEENKIAGIGNKAYWMERKRTKSATESGLVIIFDEQAITITYDHPARLTRAEVEPQLIAFFKEWSK